MTVQIVEVIDRSIQGITRPFICRGDDGNIYFVKGLGATRQSQVYEWVAGNLGLYLGLPIAPFEIVDIPEELLEFDNDLGLSELGSGPAFGSLKQHITELNYAGIYEVDEEVRRDVLAFDWWIRNSDRMMTEEGGNPNLFWDPKDSHLVVIDHNQAFDPDFNNDDFLEFHVFSLMRLDLFDDWERQRRYTTRFANALENWQTICDSIPREWYYADKEMTVPADINLEEILAMLELCQSDEFWSQQ